METETLPTSLDEVEDVSSLNIPCYIIVELVGDGAHFFNQILQQMDVTRYFLSYAIY